MKRGKKYQLFLITLLLYGLRVAAQGSAETQTGDSIPAYPNPNPGSLVLVGDIHLSGNKKTKEMIILREIPFKKGEAYTLEVLVKKFDQARKQLMNTALFSEVMVAAKNIDGETIDVIVELKERWYLFPLPYFKPVDRNINQWLFDENASLDRVNYGVKITYNNVTGHNDKFKLAVISGYTKQLSFSYDRFYLGRDLKWGMKLAFATGKNREINYNTVNDEQVFLKDENDYVRRFTNANMEVSYRRAIKTRHSLGIGFTSEQVSDTIVALNSSFFKSGRNSICYPSIYYNMSYLNLDFNPYPTKGYAAQVSISKNGLNNIINLWQLNLKGSGFWPLSNKTFVSVSAYGGLKLPFKQPYFSQRFLGYGDTFMQGFEYYVIDGAAGGYIKTGLTRELFDLSFNRPHKKSKKAEKIPVRIFGKVYGNSGYVYNQQPGENSLANRMLYSGGLGIDILCFYNVTFKFEWTFNSLGQNGLFLHH